MKNTDSLLKLSIELDEAQDRLISARRRLAVKREELRPYEEIVAMIEGQVENLQCRIHTLEIKAMTGTTK